MESRNPVIRRYADFQKPGSVLGNNTRNYDDTVITSTPVETSTDKTFSGLNPASPGQRIVTMDDVIMKSITMLGLLLIGAAIGWMTPALTIGAAIAGIVLGLVNTFKKNVSPGLVMIYGLTQGVFVGGISNLYQNYFGENTNIVGNTVMCTVIAFATMLFLFKSGIIKVDAKFIRLMMVAMVSYLVIAVISLIAMFMGVGNGWGFYGVGGLGILLALFGVGLASFTLMLDFQAIRTAVTMNLPEKESWRLAFGLTMTLVWLYLELLRLFAILAGRRD